MINSSNLNHVGGTFYTDISGQYHLRETDGEPTLTVFAGVNNVADREPPGAPSGAGNGNFILFDPVGRAFKVGLRARF
ncbi:MAG: hypothetical protein ABW136_07790 [Steroidobacteraceae bacterium]